MKTDNSEIRLIQPPVIAYDIVRAIGGEVTARIDALCLDDLEVGEDSLRQAKNLRAELNKEFAVFEERRKLVKDLVMKPYNDFEESYKEHIALSYNTADKILKEKIGGVENRLLEIKTDCLKTYFKDNNSHDFLTFEDMKLKVNQSTAFSVYHKQIDSFLLAVESDLATIGTMADNKKILVKYRISKDLNQAISQVNIENAQAEKARQIAEQKEAVSKKETTTEESSTVEPIKKESAPAPAACEEDIKEYRATFTVTGTKEQLRKLKAFMIQEGICYEN